jgi:hypothetical protein
MKNRREGSFQDNSSLLSSALSKLGATDTQQKGIEEVKDYLRNHKLNDEKMNHFLASLTPNNEHMLSIGHKREFIKLYGTFAEILEAEAVPYLSKIFAALSKKLKECNSALNDGISLAYAQVVHNTLHTLPDLESSCSQLLGILRGLFENMNSTNKVIQVGSGLCITKIVQHSPLECLVFLLDRLSLKLVQVLSSCKAHCQVVEAIISLVLSVEQRFEPFTARTVPELINHAFEEDYMCRKQVAEALYTLAAVVPQSVSQFAEEILQVLNKLRTDKAKPVRESAVEAMNLYKRMTPEPQVTKVNVKSPKESSKPKSIFRGPVNVNFFKAANNDSIVEAPERTPPYKEPVNPEQFIESPRSLSPSFREEENIEKFDFEQSIEESKINRVEEVRDSCKELKSEFKVFKDQVMTEIGQINQRLGALEEMISTVSQLFDAKLKQITCNPKIASLLRN